MKKIFILNIMIILLALSQTKQILPQTPIIYSFTPYSGPVGTVVSISGQYFKLSGPINPIISQDKDVNPPSLLKPPSDYTAVKFGTSLTQTYNAFPTSVTATHIIVPVPSGIPVGSYKIYVYNANGVEQSSSNFNVTSPPPPPIINIAYLHGFNSSSGDWQYAQGLFNQEFNASHSTNNSYNGLAAISQTASSSASTLVPYPNTVVVAHSMGGDLAREIKRQQGSNSNIRALITIGTPHTGAPIAVNADNNLGTIASWWLGDLAQGWAAIFGWQAGLDIALGYLGPIIDILNDIIDPFNLNSQAAQDLHPGSSFMNTLNSNPNSTLPAATYAIYGHEDWYSFWRMGDVQANGTETGNGLSNVLGLISYYSYQASEAYDNADFYMEEFLFTGDPHDLDEYYFWRSVAGSFINGAYALNVLHQQDWNAYMVGETLSSQNTYDRDPLDDAFIPTPSQAPSFIANHLVALHTNHLEETKNGESIAQLRIALKKPDIDLPQ